MEFSGRWTICGGLRSLSRGMLWLCVGVSWLCVGGLWCGGSAVSAADDWTTLDSQVLASRAEAYGSPQRGALLFYRSAAACATCHAEQGAQSPLGPNLSSLGPETTRAHVIESILYPSREIKPKYQTSKFLTVDGQVITGLVTAETKTHVTLRSTSSLLEETRIAVADIESRAADKVSLMPNGLAASLGGEDAFYDVVEYVVAVARGGADREAELRPEASRLKLTDDTQDLDHAGILKGLGQADLVAGRQIYSGHCVNCHGEDGNQPKLPTARAFGTQSLKFGADPLSMLKTLTLGNGLMGPMQHLSPKERYQVIYFIREAFMRDRNPDFQPLSDAYLDALPKGSGDGEWEVTEDRDFGPVLASQLGQSVQSGLSFRLPHDITVNYDLHRFRLGGLWAGGFLDLSETQHFRQRGERMPQPDGTPLAGLDAYGWELVDGFSLNDEHKPPRGPVHDDLAEYYGHYLYGDRAILSYQVHGRNVLETIDATRLDTAPVVQHVLRVEPGAKPLRLRVMQQTRKGEMRWITPGGDLVRQSPVTSLRSESREKQLLMPMVPARRGEASAGGTHQNRAWEVVSGERARGLDLGTPGRSVVVRFRTDGDGTLVASAPAEGRWAPDGKTLFLRDGRLVFDIGWVGAITGRSQLTDNRWHTAALVVTESETRLYVDGQLEGQREKFRRPPADKHVLKVGATAENFGGDFHGEIEWVAIVDEVLDPAALRAFTQATEQRAERALWYWEPTEDQPAGAEDSAEPAALFASSCVTGDVAGLTWDVDADGVVTLEIPADAEPRVIELSRAMLSEDQWPRFASYARLRDQESRVDPATMLRGGPARWPLRLTLAGQLGESRNGYALDTIEVPFENPWNAWLRTSAVDFFPDGRAVVTTHGGDVYLVDGLDLDLQRVSWKRFAAGLFEPFGVRVVDGQIYVTCRDGLKRLHDFDENGEADFVEAFWNDDDVSNMFHAYNFDLQTDAEGNFYFAKAGQYTRHHRPGAILKVPAEGGDAEVVAFGLRTPNGMGKLPDDRMTVSDNQGPWMPAGKISLATPDAFLGNMPITDEQDAWLRERFDGELPKAFDQPFIWMPQELDNSCGGQLWVDDERFGPLSGRLLHSSFGKGWLYHMSLQELDGVMQSSIIALPQQWDAGVMRLRVNPADGQVYGVGLSGWQGPAGGLDGCFQRLRYTGEPTRMIDQVRVVPEGLELTFNFAVGDEAERTDSWQAEMWDYKWSRRYGSDQFSVREPEKQGHDAVAVAGIDVGTNRQVVRLSMPTLQPCDQLWLKVRLRDADGREFQRDVYMTIHGIPEGAKRPAFRP